MKKQVLMACLAAVVGGSAGTATYSFSWYRNAPVTDFPVPLVLEEGRNGFTYSGSATGGVDLRATDGNGANLPLEIESWNPGGPRQGPYCGRRRHAARVGGGDVGSGW